MSNQIIHKKETSINQIADLSIEELEQFVKQRLHTFKDSDGQINNNLHIGKTTFYFNDPLPNIEAIKRIIKKVNKIYKNLDGLEILETSILPNFAILTKVKKVNLYSLKSLLELGLYAIVDGHLGIRENGKYKKVRAIYLHFHEDELLK